MSASVVFTPGLCKLTYDHEHVFNKKRETFFLTSSIYLKKVSWIIPGSCFFLLASTDPWPCGCMCSALIKELPLSTRALISQRLTQHCVLWFKNDVCILKNCDMAQTAKAHLPCTCKVASLSQAHDLCCMTSLRFIFFLIAFQSSLSQWSRNALKWP